MLAVRGITLTTHPSGSALDTLVRLIQETAASVDEVQHQLLTQAETASRTLDRITSGRDTVHRAATDGLLQFTGVSIDMLVARRGEGIRLLRMLTNSYADLRTSPERDSPQQIPAPVKAPPRAPRRSRA
ncbi:hypothetical protein [Streptomyces sp. Wh19]|uniref:hypothetical protein n=1 Tax=Streptomyces sp. Wh19 TaxID=3076629 RepID=UPI0029586146|nr:hypothetical protein [Streptomyces sp. Wh19]MDV9194370.1 hypothetical protein [Streptomyces sp. Wh19]